MSIGNVIIKDFSRPDPELVKQFEGMPVANIDDNMNRTAAADSSIKPVGYKGELVGTAFTVKVAQGDNLMLHAAMDLAKPGDVIVIDAGGFTNRAIFGELMATYMKSRGIKGIICDGAIRDYGGLAALEDFKVYAKAAVPNGPYKNGPGEINTPIVCGGQIVHPGDIVVADDDGILFIKPEDAELLIKATKGTEEKEAGIMRHILEDGTYIRPWVEEKLKETGTEIREK
ncbi:MAG: RraA family protein [Anaerolactibacter massiliensis]|nr:RraA family protein [Anaerolactibacter massiliensis]